MFPVENFLSATALNDFKKRISAAASAVVSGPVNVGPNDNPYHGGSADRVSSGEHSPVACGYDKASLAAALAHASSPSRPISRLLKRGRGKEPRSAALLVSGSPVFSRPWR